uniref:SH3 domain-containing protein n=1 Tax=Apteryx owenii TaxID=8824 RepID=A0A8B9QLW4_APTOW
REWSVLGDAVYVLVEYGFEYRAKDGTLVSIKPNERYVLLKRTNDHWWHVKRSGDARPFYIPAQYVKELPPMAAPAPLYEPPAAPPPAYEYRFLRAAEDALPPGTAPRRDSPPALSSFGAARAPPRPGGPPALSCHPAEPGWPTQSPDKLARATPEPQAARGHAGGDPPGHSPPFGKSRSETLHATGKDAETVRRRRGSGRVAQVR